MTDLFTAAIKEAYATAKTGAVVIETIEISHSAWAANKLITNTGEEFSAFDENSVYKTFESSSFKVKRTSKDDQGRLIMTVDLDNTNLEIKTLVDLALTVNEYPVLTYRVFLSTDITQPAEYPLVLRVESMSATVTTASLQCTNEDDINLQFPRPDFDYKASNFPGLVR